MTAPLRLAITHQTAFHYPGFAKSSYNEARMSPQTDTFQIVESARLDLRPIEPMFTYRDYFGTLVTAFDITEVHSDLDVESTSVTSSRPATRGTALPWAALADPRLRDEFMEFLTPTRRTMVNDSVTVGREEWRREADVHQVVERVGETVRARMAYVPGATNVASTGQEAWDRGKGVCQDITHVTLGILRDLGIPARYVSGYFYPKREPVVGETIVGQSHAWVEYFAGEWYGIDPTNGIGHTARHIVVGRGRDYGDVSPLKGIYHGPRPTSAGFRVEMTCLEK